jgi:hypothetical protein
MHATNAKRVQHMAQPICLIVSGDAMSRPSVLPLPCIRVFESKHAIALRVDNLAITRYAAQPTASCAIRDYVLSSRNAPKHDYHGSATWPSDSEA